MNGNYPTGVTGNESYFNPNTTAKCHECGASIDVEWDDHGISRDGERYCCADCLDNVIRLDAFTGDSIQYWIGNAEHGSGPGKPDHVEVSVNGTSREEALKKAEEYAQMTLEGVNAYVRVSLLSH